MNRQSTEVAQSPSVFARQEEKYLLAPGASEKLRFLLGSSLEPDGYGPTRIGNIYLDTPEQLLVRRSIEKPDFKEKLRIRTYGNVLDGEHPAFLELKKKYLGTVYKRRVRMTLREALRFVCEGIVPLSPYKGDAAKVTLNHQIMDEMQWTLEHYGQIRPSLAVSYERSAYTYTSPSGTLRLTLDTNARWDLPVVSPFLSPRARPGVQPGAQLGTQPGDQHQSDAQEALPSSCSRPLLPPNACIMEIKTSGALSLEFTRILNELKCFPQSFSKVGHAYEALIEGEGQQ